jgi:hypothetical protein
VIRRLADAAVTAAVGVVAGWLLAAMIPAAPRPGSGPVPAEHPKSTPKASAPRGATSAGRENCPRVFATSPASVNASREPLPGVYRDMIGPVQDKNPMQWAYDSYAAFARDVRDETWASTMEAGITVWAGGLDGREMVIDYVECRSKYCLIAGYELRGNTAQIGDLPAAGWWQADGSLSSHMVSGRDGRTDFVLFVDRYGNGRR